MKKIYGIALATLCVAGSAVAVGSALGTPKTIDVSKMQLKSAELSAKKVSPEAAAQGKMAATLKNNFDQIEARAKVMGMRKADNNPTSLEGTWTFELGDYYFQTSIGGIIEHDYEAILEDEYVIFDDPTGEELPFFGIYDEKSGTIVFEEEYIGSTGQYYVFQEPFIYNYVTNDLDVQPIVGTYVAASGLILFDEDNGISWPAYTNQAGTQMAGYFSIYDLCGATKQNGNGGIDNEGWTDLGNATFVDAWVTPGFGVDQWEADYIWEVPLQQNIANPGIYRLVDPYHLGPISEVNTSSKPGVIQFDATDPDHVVFISQEAGFANSSSGISKLYCMNTLGLYVAMGYSVEEVMEVLGDDIPYTTLKDGVLTLGSVRVDGKLQYDANFGIQGSPEGGYNWQDNVGNPINMTGQITFPEAPSTVVEAEGSMTTQIDMNQGYGDEPELTDPETYAVSASYDAEKGELTIENFAGLEPVTFTVNAEAGLIAAEGKQLAYHEEFTEDGETYTFDYYYGDVTTQEFGLQGTIIADGDKCELTVAPWGEAMEWDGGLFFNSAYYNTVITLDLTIEGLPEKPDYTTIEGEWTFFLDDHYAGDWSLGEQEVVYTATLDGNKVTFNAGDEYVIVAEFTNGYELTFNYAVVGDPNAMYPLCQNPYTDGSKVGDIGIDPENFVFESFNATYEPESGTIAFAPGCGLAYGNAKDGVFQYYMAAFDLIKAEKIFDNSYIEGTYTWEILATDIEGTMIGGTTPIQVEVKKVEGESNSFTVSEIGDTNYFNDQVIPFTYNAASKIAQFEAAYAGEMGDEPVWFSAFTLNEGTVESASSFIEPQPTFAVTFDEEKGFEFKGNSGFAWFITTSAAEFDVTGVYSAFYVNPDFKYSAVENIEAAGGEVRYFNLQGVEVKNPAKGNILIRVEGNKASKVIVK